jgi:glycosyltransferase involved in cell wall biosynthesis
LNPSKQGYKVHCKNIKAGFSEIYNGYNPEKWKCESEKEPKSFITVAFNIGNQRINNLKGIDLILQIADSFPDCKFYLVGANEQFIQKNKINNIISLPPLPPEDLKSIYSKSAFYLQLSISEGFPNSLCEAMLCECIPIGSNVGGIPTIINDTGFLLEKKDPEKLKEIIKKALEINKDKLKTAARNRIAENFTETKRKEKLLNLIDQLINGEVMD